MLLVNLPVIVNNGYHLYAVVDNVGSGGPWAALCDRFAGVSSYW